MPIARPETSAASPQHDYHTQSLSHKCNRTVRTNVLPISWDSTTQSLEATEVIASTIYGQKLRVHRFAFGKDSRVPGLVNHKTVDSLRVYDDQML